MQRAAGSVQLGRAAPARALRPAAARPVAPRRAALQLVRAGEVWAPPPVSAAKEAFLASFARPLPALYSGVVQELLVQQHLFRWNKAYAYNEVTALGIVSIFDEVLEGLPPAERDAVFNAFIAALQEDPAKYRADAAALEAWAAGLPDGAAGVRPDAGGDGPQQALARVAAAAGAGEFLYTKFFAVGLFRLLEAAGGKDPKALAGLVAALGVPAERVNADLLTYKGVLSKLAAAKTIMAEFIEREKRKVKEREAAKQAKAEATASA